MEKLRPSSLFERVDLKIFIVGDYLKDDLFVKLVSIERRDTGPEPRTVALVAECPDGDATQVGGFDKLELETDRSLVFKVNLRGLAALAGDPVGGQGVAVPDELESMIGEHLFDPLEGGYRAIGLDRGVLGLVNRVPLVAVKGNAQE